MSTVFDRRQYGFRFIETQFGDTLQLLALRHLGDASRWTELVSYNNLIPPYITDNKSEVQPGVILSGSLLLVPASTPASDENSDPEQVLRTDIQLYNGRLVFKNGDFATVSGLDNLKQGLKNALDTDRGDLMFHPLYGSLMRQLVGAINGPTRGLLAAQYGRGTVENDDRIAHVNSATAQVSGDVILVTIDAESVVGKPVQITASI